MPGHHGSEIAAAEENTDLREAYIINEVIYAGIIAAGSAQAALDKEDPHRRLWRLRAARRCRRSPERTNALNSVW
jgi:hypothetical protein